MGRCDTCNKRLEKGETVWTYTTPSTVASPEEAIRLGEGYWFEDPEWAVCRVCNVSVEAFLEGAIDEVRLAVILVKRSMFHQHTVMVGMPEAEEKRFKDEQQDHIMRVLAAFVKNVKPNAKEELV